VLFLTEVLLLCCSSLDFVVVLVFSELVWKVARYTSAAPFYFKEFEGYIDGGMMANNMRGEKLPISLVVSIGSGLNPSSSLGEIDIKSNPLDPKRYMDLLRVIAAAVSF